MIPFFRKIRKKMADDNKPIKYFRYAIGEIVLVVIGILIALQINTWNEKRISQLIMNGILKQVHSELGNNIKRANELVLHYVAIDSIIGSIMNNELKDNDYENFRTRKQLISDYDVMTISDRGYEKLILYNNNSSSYIDSLITELNNIYVMNKEEVDWANGEMERINRNHFNWLKNNTNWYNEQYYSNDREVSDKEFNFYKSNNSIFKNFVFEYYLRGINNHYPNIMIFRNNAIESYRKLTEKLMLSKNETDTFSFKLSDEETQKIVGSYVNQRGKDTIKIAVSNNTLYYTLNNGDKDEMAFLNKTFFILKNRNYSFRIFNLDENNNVIGFTVRLRNNEYKWQKLK